MPMHRTGARCFKFIQSYFVTKLCNMPLCYTKAPAGELNFVPLTLVQGTPLAKNIPRNLRDAGEGWCPASEITDSHWLSLHEPGVLSGEMGSAGTSHSPLLHSCAACSSLC